jgi:hydrogenase-4 membrane subunit HyfE
MNLESLIGMAQAMIPPLELALLFTALYIVTTSTVSHIISAYRWQTGLLIALATSRLVGQWDHMAGAWGFIVALLALPFFLLLIIRWALVLATISETKWRSTEVDHIEADRAWREANYSEGKKPSLARMAASMGIYLILIVFAFIIAFSIPQIDDLRSQMGLGVSLALQFAGLFTMINKRDIISQVVGLLVMDHGMYLVMILLTNMPHPAKIFLLALYFYTFITLLLLFFMLPNLRRITQSIALDYIRDSSQLKG